MKKLGFSRKGDGDEDSNRSALFGSRKKSPNPQSSNPYANLPTQADAYNQAKSRAGVPGAQRGHSPVPPPAQNGEYGSASGYPEEKKNRYGDDKTGGYGGLNDPAPRNGGGYAPNPYGTQDGYGANRFNSGDGASGGSRSRPGGYGGMGNTTAVDDNRDALFGGAKERVQQKSQQQMGYPAPPAYEESQPGNYGGGGSSYEAYGDRQLTAEEEEEEDVQATKQQIKFIKQEDVSSTRNALRIAAQAEET